MSLESGKWVGRVKAVVSGKITKANEDIEFDSTIINQEPYEGAWFATVQMAGEPAGLLKASDPDYAAFIEEQRAKYNK